MASKKKIIVGKDDLRRLMKEKQTSLKTSNKRIEHPLAKYNTLDQLSCTLCNALVKNQMLWNAHLQGRTHKENLARLKAEKEAKESAFVQPAKPRETSKRKLDDLDILAIARGQKALPSKQKRKKESSDPEGSDNAVPDTKLKSILKSSSAYADQNHLGLGGYDSDDSDDEDSNAGYGAPVPPMVPSGSVVSQQPGLPADFFDPGVPSASTSDTTKTETDVPDVMAEKLPEGFFDDPKMDAKIRQVEYRDKMDDEWDMFQRAIKEQTHVSEEIQAEDDEEANEERNILEVEEQLKKWSKIDELAKKKEQLLSSEKDTAEIKAESDDNSSDDIDLDELLDWRSKTAFT